MVIITNISIVNSPREGRAGARGRGGEAGARGRRGGSSRGKKEEFKFASAKPITEGTDKGKSLVDMDDLMDF